MKHRVLPIHELVRPLGDEIVDVLQRHAVGRERARIVAQLLLQPRHPDFEEFDLPKSKKGGSAKKGKGDDDDDFKIEEDDEFKDLFNDSGFDDEEEDDF